GPVWVLSSFYMAAGLAGYVFVREARDLALKTARLLSSTLARDGMLHECYSDSGQGLWPRTGTFLSWNVLPLTMLREHVGEASARFEAPLATEAETMATDPAIKD